MKRLNNALLVLGLAFLLYLVWKVGPDELWHEVGTLGWGLIPIILCEGLGNLAHALGWRHCLARAYPPVALLRLFRMSMAGFAINYLTPSASLGGEVSRASLLASIQSGPAAVSSVILDKLMTAVAHLTLAVLGSLFLLWRVKLPLELWLAMAVITCLLTGGMTAFLLLQKYGKLGGVFRWLVAHNLGGLFLEGVAHRMSEVDEALKKFYLERPWDLVFSLLWHVLGHSAALVQAWLFLTVLQQPAPVATVAAAGFLSLWFDLMTFAIPLNLGTLEGSRILVFKALGCPALLGMTYGLAVRLGQVFWACFGLISYSLFTTRKRGRDSAAAGCFIGDRGRAESSEL
jgi:uncharacterized protein (TIRG00374 family)